MNIKIDKSAETSNRHLYFKRRLKELSLYDSDSDYGGALGKQIEELSLVFANQHHSGASSQIVLAVWNKLQNEWNDGTAFKS